MLSNLGAREPGESLSIANAPPRVAPSLVCGFVLLLVSLCSSACFPDGNDALVFCAALARFKLDLAQLL